MSTRVTQLSRLPVILLTLSLLSLALTSVGVDPSALALPASGTRETALAANAVSSPGQAALSAAPSATAAFLAAYARGDEATADSFASPLYRAEWERRGLSAEVRTGIAWPDHRPGEAFQERLRFTFVGGVVDALGFGHLLFAVRPALPDRPVTPSVFRVDVDQSGRVIWLELVWCFAEDVDAVQIVQDPVDLSRVPSPATCCARVLFGVASSDGREGYYAYALEGKDTASSSLSDQGQTTRPGAVRYFAVDQDQQIRPGAWTYNAPTYGLSEYGKPEPERGAPRLEAQDAALWQSYLSAVE